MKKDTPFPRPDLENSVQIFLMAQNERHLNILISSAQDLGYSQVKFNLDQTGRLDTVWCEIIFFEGTKEMVLAIERC